MGKKLNLIGKKFNQLTVLEEYGKDNSGHTTWRCICDCGNETIVGSQSLKGNNIKSCGCLRKKVASRLHTKHGQHNNSTYQSWANMLDRCYNSNNHAYNRYGGRGIKVYRKWWKFENFYKDMGDKPKDLTLERIDNNDDYKPSNCKWTSMTEQQQNKRAKGYCWNKNTQKWRAIIYINYKQIHLGYFNKEEDARQAYLNAKKKYHINHAYDYLKTRLNK